MFFFFKTNSITNGVLVDPMTESFIASNHPLCFERFNFLFNCNKISVSHSVQKRGVTFRSISPLSDKSLFDFEKKRASSSSSSPFSASAHHYLSPSLYQVYQSRFPFEKLSTFLFWCFDLICISIFRFVGLKLGFGVFKPCCCVYVSKVLGFIDIYHC